MGLGTVKYRPFFTIRLLVLLLLLFELGTCTTYSNLTRSLHVLYSDPGAGSFSGEISQHKITRDEAEEVVCSKASVLSAQQVSMIDKVTGKEIYSTVVTIPHMRLKETVCFMIKDSKGTVLQYYAISLKTVRTRFPYLNNYHFGIPEVKAECICDCPGGEDFCNADTKNCKTDTGTCFRIFDEKQATTGCSPVTFGSSEVCCGVNVSPLPRTSDLKAIELGYGHNLAHLVVTNLNDLTETGADFDLAARDILPVGAGMVVDLASPYIKSPVSPGWYFGKSRSGSLGGVGDLKIGIPVNPLNEYHLDKLGWYKYNVESGEFHMDETTVKSSVMINVKNCATDDMDLTFKAKYFSQNNSKTVLQEAKDVRVKYVGALSGTRRDDGANQYEAWFNQYGRSQVTVTLAGTLTVQQVTENSKLLDFSASVNRDKDGNNFINMTVYAAKGTIHGYMKVAGSKEADDIFSFFIPKDSKEYEVFIRIFGKCDDKDRTTISIFPEGDKTLLKTHEVLCNEEKMDDFVLPNDTINYDKGEKDSILSPQFWLKHINPYEWFQGPMAWKEAVVMGTELFGVAGIVGLIVKMLRVCGCLRNCCVCLYCADEKDNEKKPKQQQQNQIYFINTMARRRGGTSEQKLKRNKNQESFIDKTRNRLSTMFQLASVFVAPNSSGDDSELMYRNESFDMKEKRQTKKGKRKMGSREDLLEYKDKDLMYRNESFDLKEERQTKGGKWKMGSREDLNMLEDIAEKEGEMGTIKSKGKMMKGAGNTIKSNLNSGNKKEVDLKNKRNKEFSRSGSKEELLNDSDSEDGNKKDVDVKNKRKRYCASKTPSREELLVDSEDGNKKDVDALNKRKRYCASKTPSKEELLVDSEEDPAFIVIGR